MFLFHCVNEEKETVARLYELSFLNHQNFRRLCLKQRQFAVSHLSFALEISTVLLVLFHSADNKFLWRIFLENFLSLFSPLSIHCVPYSGTWGMAQNEQGRAELHGQAEPLGLQELQSERLLTEKPRELRQWAANRNSPLKEGKRSLNETGRGIHTGSAVAFVLWVLIFRISKDDRLFFFF